LTIDQQRQFNVLKYTYQKAKETIKKSECLLAPFQMKIHEMEVENSCCEQNISYSKHIIYYELLMDKLATIIDYQKWCDIILTKSFCMNS
jgi:hypothetical protein